MKTLLLIDANSIIHRAFHALPPLTTKERRPIQAIYGLASILLKIWREERPNFVAALFDRPEPTFREKKYAQYKAQRPPTPAALIFQLGEAHNLFNCFGIKTFEASGFEADDLIATLTEKFKNKPNLKIIILTGDRDTLQLVEDDKVLVKTFKKGVSETFIYNEEKIKEIYGLKPKELIDYKSLVGDPSDNIKGVPKIGPKTALFLIKKFNSIEKLYKNLDFDLKLKEKLKDFEKEAKIAKELVTLQKNAPLPRLSLDDLTTKDLSEMPEIGNYFKKMGFKTLLERLNQATFEKLPRFSQGVIF